MREIKFRVWNARTKEMFLPANNFAVNLNSVFERSHHGYWMNLSDTFNNELKIMQFTGLKDKNSKEIYEGDILSRVWYKLDEKLSNPKEQKDIKVVEWNNETGFNFKLSEFPMGWMWEVVGNIFETPELLSGHFSDKELEKIK